MFAVDPANGEALSNYVAHSRLFASRFLEAGSYNAAKHGMAIGGGSERHHVDIAGVAVIQEQGPSVRWLEEWAGDEASDPQWTRVTRLISPEATIESVLMAIDLMRSVWVRARTDHLGFPLEAVGHPTAPGDLFRAVGVLHPVLTEMREPIPASGEARQVVISTLHIRTQPTAGPEQADREPAGDGD